MTGMMNSDAAIHLMVSTVSWIVDILLSLFDLLVECRHRDDTYNVGTSDEVARVYFGLKGWAAPGGAMLTRLC